MTFRQWFGVAVVASLAACTPPQTACERAASAELRALDSRIIAAEQDIARGFQIIPEQAPETRLRLCAWPKEPVLFCTETLREARSETRVPIDRARAEQDLTTLRAERAALSSRIAHSQLQCP